MKNHRNLIAAVTVAAGLLGGLSGPNDTTIDGASALRLLEEGHFRFMNGQVERPRTDLDRVRETGTNGQKPFVTVLSCSDSRVPVETIFDQGIGDVFVIRVAGNVADTDEIGTTEYGCGHLGTRLVLVLGHTKCGAVTAVASGAEVHGSIAKLVDNVQPAVATAKHNHPGVGQDELVRHAIDENVLVSMRDLIVNSHEIAGLVQSGKVKVVGAVYDVATGDVKWIGEHPKQTELVHKGMAGHGGHDTKGHAAKTAKPKTTKHH